VLALALSLAPEIANVAIMLDHLALEVFDDLPLPHGSLGVFGRVGQISQRAVSPVFQRPTLALQTGDPLLAGLPRSHRL
jgi:hypothetical protein